ncbi:hypothetical protein Lfee_0070 [Legionella feeleii]|uniref:VirK protein n=2 Tax=Legionella feeleii TaxID=453 RepID=A0A0W0UAF5_9GAMM|nr:hypothetical protein Lfee_0070 [Legionella feeleii]SPX62166.1 Uncharacterised protein [Legionella feeleii]STX37804.1 Uncharacterised protein [Legionella feeleii]
MKLKSLLFVSCLGLLTSVYADNNRHVHPQANADAAEAKSVMKRAMMPGYCEIEVVNDGYDDIRVYGVFDDGTLLEPFNIYRYERPHYISLLYRDGDGVMRCHAGMRLDINTSSGWRLVARRAYVGETVYPFRFGRKAEVKAPQ